MSLLATPTRPHSSQCRPALNDYEAHSNIAILMMHELSPARGGSFSNFGDAFRGLANKVGSQEGEMPLLQFTPVITDCERAPCCASGVAASAQCSLEANLAL